MLLRVLLLLSLLACVLGADYYKTLGVKKGASKQEIKKAYRKLAKELHPDKNPDPAAAQKFLDVGHAFEILSDKEKRKTYDQYGEEGLKKQQGGGFHDPFDIFRNAFGGGGQQQQRRGQNMVADVEVDLQSIYTGDSMTFNLARKETCTECEGSGARSDQDIVQCSTCDGRGIRLIRHQLGPGMFTQVQAHCDQCGGRGKITKHVCAVCKGNRIVDSTAELNLHVDRGVPEGTEVVFEGEADESPDFVAGDIVLRIRSRRSVGGFERRGSNLYWRETLSVAEALLGFTKSVKGLDGHAISLQRTGTTQPGFVQIITGEGLPIYHDSGHGDLYVEYTVVLPTSVSPKTHKSLSSILGYKSPNAGHNEL